MSKLNKMREQIANEFIAALQHDEIPWHQDWHSVGTPHNAVTGRGYHGLNFFWLSCVAMQKNYSDPRWCTFNQAKTKAQTLVQTAKNELELESQKAMMGLKDEIADLVVLTAEKVIKQKLNQDEQEKIIDDIFVDFDL